MQACVVLMELGPLKCIRLYRWYLNLCFEVEKLKRIIQSPGFDDIPTELIKGSGETMRSAIRKLFNYVYNMEELPEDC
jgi:hypothetical protein